MGGRDGLGNRQRSPREPLGPVVPQPRPARIPPPADFPLLPDLPPDNANRPELLRGDVAGYTGRSINLSGFQARAALLHATGHNRNPELVTLQLFAATPEGKPAPYQVNARIGWGVGGGRHDALVTIGRGTEVTLAATSLDVSAELLPVFPAQVDPAVDVLVRAVFASGARPGSAPRLQQNIAAPALAGPIALEPPPWAVRVAFLSSVSLAGLQVDQTGPATTLLARRTFATELDASAGVQVVSGADLVTVAWPGPAATLIVLWTLDL